MSQFNVTVAQGRGARGASGETGLVAMKGDWITGTLYPESSWAYHAKSGYGKCAIRATVEHTSGATTEPFTGANWEDVWEEGPAGGQNGEVIMDGTPAENDIMLRGSLDKHVATSGIQFETTLTADSDAKAPTSEAVAEYIAAGISSAAISGTSLAINGPIKPSVLAKTATYEILDTDPDIIVMGAIGAHSTITLPTAADNTGRIITVVIDGEPGAFNVVVDGEGAETINGAATKTNSVIYSYLRLLCNGAGWDIIGSGGTWT